MTADLSPSDYDTFAPFYDAFTAASDYETWAREALAAATRHGLAGDSLLDLACGTGKSFLPFLRRGFAVTGCDASSAMLAEAAIKAPEVELVRRDIRELPSLGSFDLVTCFDDSLNYMLDPGGLAASFRGIAANLAPGGVALFDLNTLRAYRTTFERDSVSERDGTVFAWRGESSPDFSPGEAATARIDIFAARGDGLYERTVTRHEQRHFPRGEVEGLLRDAGLRCVAVYGALDDGPLVEPADESAHLKVLYIARHAEGGVGE
jgi:SAM-dependent methyltransferase